MQHFIHVNMGLIRVWRGFIENQILPELFPPPLEPTFGWVLVAI